MPVLAALPAGDAEAVGTAVEEDGRVHDARRYVGLGGPDIHIHCDVCGREEPSPERTTYQSQSVSRSRPKNAKPHGKL